MTARDLIRRSLMLIGVLAEGENPSADQQADGIAALNDMLDSWSTESLFVGTITTEKFSLVSGTARYTIGTSGTFNTSRPITVERATIEDQSASPKAEYPLEIINVNQWADITTKDTQAPIPTRVFFEGSSPLNALNLYPTPSAANKIVLYSEKPLTQVTNANTVIDLLPGFARALRYNLAVELAPEYGKAVSAEVAAIAAEAKGNMKRLNIKNQLLETDSALAGSQPFNIITGV